MVQFPDVADHVNLAFYCNLMMMVGIIYSPTDPTGADGDPRPPHALGSLGMGRLTR